MKSSAKLKKIKGDASFREFYRNKKNKSIVVVSKKEKLKNLLIYDAINKILIKINNKDIKTISDVIEQNSKNGIKKPVNILLKRKNKFIKLKVRPTDVTNLQNN